MQQRVFFHQIVCILAWTRQNNTFYTRNFIHAITVLFVQEKHFQHNCLVWLCLRWRSCQRHYILGLSVHTSVPPNFLCFLCNRLSDWHKFFTISRCNTHIECFNDNYDVLFQMVWQRCWKKGNTLNLYIFETTPWKKLKLGTWEMSLIFFIA